MIQKKRAYEAASKNDGYRILVDRLWPRGIKKEDLLYNAWWKDLAPSTELRKKFGHDPKCWSSFKSQYKKELESPKALEKIKQIVDIARKSNVTLIFGAHDESHNNAVVLKQVIEELLLRT